MKSKTAKGSEKCANCPYLFEEGEDMYSPYDNEHWVDAECADQIQQAENDALETEAEFFDAEFELGLTRIEQLGY